MCRIHVSPIPVSTDLLQKNAHIMCSLFVSYSHSFSLTAVLNVDKDLDSGAKDDGSEWIVWTEYYEKIDGLNDHWAKGRVMSHVQLMPYHILVSLTLTYYHIISYPSTNTGQASGMLGDFMGMVTGEDAEAKFIQPLKVLHEVNHLIPTKDKPRASLSDLSNAAQLLVVFTVPKELVVEAQKMIDDHAIWMKELHGNHKMLGRDISFNPNMNCYTTLQEVALYL